MTNFDAFFPTLLKHEGGFVNDPKDRGGATNKGVTFRTFKAHARKLLGVAPTLENLKALTDDQAAAIYKREYWDRIKADDYPSQKLATFAFDFYVNSGSHAIKTLQRVLRDMGQPVSVDGGVGPQTLGALRAVDPDELYRRYKEARRTFFRRIADRDPSQKRFLRGWLNRVNAFPD